jgi:phospho-N-acetylmuramoyl-pentapeptide-transferase
MYLVEAISVILQVLYCKLTKKRLFLMAPLHHHFEKKGKSEVKITAGFTFVTVCASVIAYLFA